MLRTPVLAVALAVFALPAIAATPESGSITDTQYTIEWTGGPYIVPNLTPTLPAEVSEEPVCEEGTDTCDVYRFEINLTNVNLDDDQAILTVEWNDPVPDDANPVANLPDYDLYLYNDDTGERVTTQASAANPEIMFIIPANGRYRLEVIPFAAMNEPYSGKVQFMKLEEGKNGAISFFGGALNLPVLLGLLGFAALARRRAAAGLLLASVLAASPAIAADPASGKISHEEIAAEWSGELLTPNPGGSDVPVICEEGTPTCDVYRFEADLPDANLDDDLITIKLEWSAPAAEVDIDVYIYNDSTGEEVGSGTASGGGAEAVFIPAVSGKYRVVVIPWAAAAQSYTGVVKYEKFEEGKSGLGFAGAFGAGTLLALALGFALRRRATMI